MSLGQVLLTAIVTVSLLAGCAGPDAASANAAGDSSKPPLPSASDPVPDSVTGSLTGSVVDDETLPLAGATVAIAEHEFVTSTDDLGRFTFNALEPGTFTLQVNKIGYVQIAKKVDILAGDVTEVHVVLAAIYIPVPRVEHYLKDGYVEIGLGTPVASLHRTVAGTDGSELRDFYFPVGNDTVSTVVALAWDQSAPMTANYIHFNLHTCIVDECELVDETYGSSPLLIRNDTLREVFAGRSGTQLSTYFNIQGCYRAAEPTNVTSCNADTLVQVGLQQRFTVYLDAFFVDIAPVGYSPLPPDA